MTPTMELQTAEFTRTARSYAAYSKRDAATILNTKGFFIARRAVLETPKADFASMARELGQELRVTRNGKLTSRGGGHFNSASSTASPLLALVINARRGRAGKPGLQGQDMAEAFHAVFGARAKSIAFLKSGWLPTIHKLEPLADKGGAPRADSSVKQVGVPKGWATPARPDSLMPYCIITNAADAKRDRKQSLIKYGLPALQRAFDFEVASMKTYILKKQLEAARRFGIAVGGIIGP